MKELSSQCLKLPFTSVLRVLFVFLCVSCTVRHDSLPDGHEKTLGMFKAGFLDDVECLNLKAPLHTPLGRSIARLHLDLEKNRAYIQLDDSLFEFPAANPPSNICKGEPAAFAFFADLLEQSIPACNISKKADGFSCTVNYNTAAQSLERIKAIKYALMRQVKRVPYLLSRRLALTENLAVILNNSSQWEEGMKSFCGVMKASLPAEQPLILSAKPWKNALCNSSKTRFEAALIVLSKAVEEISFLHILQDQINLPGSLLVQVQNDMLPASGKVWVKLEAASTTLENVLAASEAVQGMVYELVPTKRKDKRKSLKQVEIAKADLEHMPHIPRTCWFPGFSMKEKLFGPGRKMQLWGNHNGIPCSQEDKKMESKSIAQYFIETISSETSFELSETNTKALSLPAGPYHYTVYEFPDKLGTQLEQTVVDQGLIVWNGSQQGLTIAKAK